MKPTPSVATAVAASAALLAGALGTAAPATAAPAGAELAPRSTFTMPVDETNGTVTLPDSGEGIPNIDSVKATIRRYYNATGGVADKTSSRYLSEVAALEQQLLDSLPATQSAGKAVVFDIDDTLLWNYDFEDQATNFNFDGAVNAAWVHDQRFPAVPGMPDVVATIASRGYAVYAVTGRPSYQEPDTIANLVKAGFTAFDADNTFTKWGTNATPNQPDTYDAGEVPDYIANGQCTTHVGSDPTTFKCTTVEYKAQTRKHIEDTDHVEIVANVGDQLSDLWGGYADRAWKIPNPTYFLASPDLDAAHRGPDDQADELRLPDVYTMAPDGSSGLTTAGDRIPNIDPVRTEIRAYYAATGGIANKASSPYISELATLQKAWDGQIADDCRRGNAVRAAAQATVAAAQARLARAERRIATVDRALARARKALRKAHRHHWSARAAHARRAIGAAKRTKRQALAARRAALHTLARTTVPGRPAAVFDADDTTLWTYDMEDAAMRFVFNPTVQNDEWVQPQRFPAVPGMPELVADVADAGCTIIGLTGRGETQKYATLGNLLKVGYTDFRANNYYTKPAVMPAYVDCNADGKPACSTIEYKSGTRRMLEESRGLHIVANLGDQFSDLLGGHADRTYKLPNPTYYLP